MIRCEFCHQPVKGTAQIGDDWYCHEGDSPTCYELAQQEMIDGPGEWLLFASADDAIAWLGEDPRL